MNPVAHIEVPYDTENDWTLVSEEQPDINYHWRDKGDTNSGHLVLSSPHDLTMTVWVAAGDDFEFINFTGLSYVTSTDDQQMLDDAHGRFDNLPVVKMDPGFCGEVARNLSSLLPGTGPVAGAALLVTAGAQRVAGMIGGVECGSWCFHPDG